MQSSFKWFKGSSYKNCDLKQFLAAAGSNYLPQVHINRAILIPSSTIGVQHLAELGLRQNQRARLIDYSPAATSRIILRVGDLSSLVATKEIDDEKC